MVLFIFLITIVTAFAADRHFNPKPPVIESTRKVKRHLKLVKK